MAKLIFGCGYLGLRVARLWLAAGERVYAVTRTAERAAVLAAEGVEPIVSDVAAGGSPPLPQDVETVLWAVGFGRSRLPGGTLSAEKTGASDTDARSGSASPTYPIHDLYVGGLASAVIALPATVRRFIYISSTGVYGQVTGDEVDEDSPCEPTRGGGRATLAAENGLRTGPLANRTIIVRLAGLYGPGRIPRSKELLAGEPIDAPSKGWLNLIHVEDAARIVLLAEAKAPLPSLYVVSDGQPVERADYYRELARLLGAPPPRFIEPPAGSHARERAGSNKRVNPRRLFAELGPTLAYPSYREGLAAIVASGQ
jgi:nucleoside-diphosphate-sugar epimerase